MGRGGEKGASPKAATKKAFTDVVSTASKPWEALPTEELRKKAQRFGHDANADRATLLKELVRACVSCDMCSSCGTMGTYPSVHPSTCDGPTPT